MATLQVQQVRCPNCGSALNEIKMFAKDAKCNYCGTVFQITGTMSKELEMPERITPFQTTADQFEHAVLKWLVKGDYTPDDILHSTIFKDVQGVYLPMFLYEGNYDCSWNCSVGYKEREQYVNSNNKVSERTVTRYRPQSGSTKGNYKVLGLAYDGDEMRPEIINYAQNSEYNERIAQEFDSKLLEGYRFMGFNLNSESIWDKFAKDKMEETAANTALSQVPGDSYKDFSASVAHTQKHEGRKVFIPFWIVYYEYKGTQYHVLADGTNLDRIQGERPVDNERVETVKAFYKYFKYFTYFAYGWVAWGVLKVLLLPKPPVQGFLNVFYSPLFSGTWFLRNLVLAMIGGGLWLFAKYQEKDLLKKSQAARDASLQSFISGAK
jgi:hypothetical protein